MAYAVAASTSGAVTACKLTSTYLLVIRTKRILISLGWPNGQLVGTINMPTSPGFLAGRLD